MLSILESNRKLRLGGMMFFAEDMAQFGSEFYRKKDVPLAE